MRLAIISDIHGNLEALRAVARDIDSSDCDRIVCAGDIVGYGPEPEKCIELIRERSSGTIGGNHDYALRGDFPIEKLNGMARAAIIWSRERLSECSTAYLKTLCAAWHADGWMMAHGSPENPEDFTYAHTPFEASRAFACFSEKVCFVGHTHIPLIFTFKRGRITKDHPGTKDLLDGERYLVNVGSVGQPRDLDNRACYCIFDEAKQRLEFKRVPYNIAKTMNDIRRNGLPSFLAERLLNGQ